MKARLAALVAVSLWGASFVATRVALGQIDPIALVVTRFGMGVLLLFAWLALRRELALPPRAAWGRIALLGLLGILVHQLLQAHALELTLATHAGWLVALTPLWSAVIAALALREKIGARKLAGLALGFAGAILVVAGRPAGLGLPNAATATGDLLLLVSTFNWAAVTALSPRLVATVGAARAAAWPMALGWSLLLPLFAWHAGWRAWGHLDASGWTAVIFLGVGCSGVAYACWVGALGQLPSSSVAAFLYVEPLVTLAAASVILAERPGLVSVAGGLAVLAGVALAQG